MKSIEFSEVIFAGNNRVRMDWSLSGLRHSQQGFPRGFDTSIVAIV